MPKWDKQGNAIITKTKVTITSIHFCDLINELRSKKGIQFHDPVKTKNKVKWQPRVFAEAHLSCQQLSSATHILTGSLFVHNHGHWTSYKNIITKF